MASVFSERALRAIREYRCILRKHLTQPERMIKLRELNLRKPNLASDAALFHYAHAIVNDIEACMLPTKRHYLSYSGIEQFCVQLKQFISQYTLRDGCVINVRQRAAQALLYAIQVLTDDPGDSSEELIQQVLQKQREIALYGTSEQIKIYQAFLSQKTRHQSEHHPSLLENFIKCAELSEAGHSEKKSV